MSVCRLEARVVLPVTPWSSSTTGSARDNPCQGSPRAQVTVAVGTRRPTLVILGPGQPRQARSHTAAPCAGAPRGAVCTTRRAELRWLPASSLLLPSVFGHISFRSDWELVKVDFRPSFSRLCTEEDYGSWDLTDLQVAGPSCVGGWALSCPRPPPARPQALSSKRPSQSPDGFRRPPCAPLVPGLLGAGVSSACRGCRSTGTSPVLTVS